MDQPVLKRARLGYQVVSQEQMRFNFYQARMAVAKFNRKWPGTTPMDKSETLLQYIQLLDALRREASDIHAYVTNYSVDNSN